MKHYVPYTTEKTKWSVTQGKLQITQRKKARTAMSMIHESLKKNNSHVFILVLKIRQICSPQITSSDGFQPPSHKRDTNL